MLGQCKLAKNQWQYVAIGEVDSDPIWMSQPLKAKDSKLHSSWTITSKTFQSLFLLSMAGLAMGYLDSF